MLCHLVNKSFLLAVMVKSFTLTVMIKSFTLAMMMGFARLTVGSTPHMCFADVLHLVRSFDPRKRAHIAVLDLVFGRMDLK